MHNRQPEPPPCHPELVEGAFAISVPASSANLGPGFDCVGIALDLRARAMVQPAARFSLEFSGAEQPTHPGFERMLLAAMHSVSADLPRVRVQLVNAIPLGKGLGSSAAARVLGVTIAARAHGMHLTRDDVAHRACELEGHPDNALPAVYGGIAIATSARTHASIKLAAPRDLYAIVTVPDFDFATAQARALLPAQYTRNDFVFNVQRAALLGAALASGSWSVLREAMNDRLHQPYRAAIVPGLAAALARRRTRAHRHRALGRRPERACLRARTRRMASARRTDRSRLCRRRHRQPQLPAALRRTWPRHAPLLDGA